jgi:hypothetical protein
MPSTYVEFRRAIDLMVLNNTCRCNACANVSALDLKFFVHYGPFAIQTVGEITQLVGADVNLVHRLLKNSISTSTGVQAYLVLTETAVSALDLDGSEEDLISHTEDVADFGEIRVVVKDLHPVYESARRSGRTFYRSEDVLISVAIDIPMPIEHVWNYANQSRFRNLIIGSDSYEVSDRKAGRVATGSTYQCYHGKMIVSQLVLEWLPFQRVVLEQRVPIPGRRPTTAILDLEFTSMAEGTRLSETATKPTGPLIQRLLAKLMMTSRRSRIQAEMEDFRRQIIDDFRARNPHLQALDTLPASLIESAAAQGVETSQAALER